MRARAMVGTVMAAGLALAACGSSAPSATSTTSSTTTTTAATVGTLQPAALGQGQCQASVLADGSGYGQAAVAGGATCTELATVAAGAASAKGSPYTAAGFTCTPTAEGAASQWASAWGGDYYAYSCADGTQQLAFAWGVDYIYGSAVGQTTEAGALQPAALGEGQCQAAKLPGGSTYAQIAASNAACSTAVLVAAGAPAAAGKAYDVNGFHCTGTKEGTGSSWAGAWGAAYYAYSCAYGTEQVAFTWGTDYTYP